MYSKIQIIAQLELFSGENKRRSPFTSSYRPLFDFDGANSKISGKIDLIDRDSFLPGASGIVKITFLKEMMNTEYLSIGQAFTISEDGQNNLGRGEIVKFIDEE